MYISRLELNLKSQMVRSELSNIYEHHRSLMQGFPRKEEGGSGRVLFRIENELACGLSVPVLVVSERQPDESRYRGKYINNFETKEYQVNVKAGAQLRFCLRANPTVKRNGKRVGLKSIQEQERWMLQKSKQGGFTLTSLTFDREDDVKGTGGIYFQSVLYKGILTVDDEVEFQNALYNGIGSAKGFGFGLLSVGRC